MFSGPLFGLHQELTILGPAFTNRQLCRVGLAFARMGLRHVSAERNSFCELDLAEAALVWSYVLLLLDDLEHLGPLFGRFGVVLFVSWLSLSTLRNRVRLGIDYRMR